MLTLFDHGLSPFAQKVKMALLEKAIPFECVVPDLAAPDARFLAASPLKEVPALIDGDVALFQSAIIVEYLEDKWPANPILASDPVDRARSRTVQAMCDTQFEAVVFSMTEFMAFKRAEGEVAQAMLAQARKDVAHLLQWLSAQLGPRPYFNGQNFGLGDMAALPYLATASLYKLGPASDSPLGQWFERCRQRPSFQRCQADAKAELAGFKESVARVQSGQWPRQYRDHRLDWFIRSGGTEIVTAGLKAGTIRLSCLPQIHTQG
jgi:glutathione S-transferase/RNA polymerase-associated protein